MKSLMTILIVRSCELPVITCLNASLAYTLGNYKLVLWGENLSDERFVNAGDANFVIGFLEANYNLPRTYGFTVRREF